MNKCLLILFLAVSPFSGIAQTTTPPNLEACFSAIIVKDIDQSIVWYSSILGFELVNRNGSEEMGFKQANLQRGSNLIELIELKSSHSAFIVHS